MNEEKALRDLRRGSQRALEWFIDTYNAYVSTIAHNILGATMGIGDVEEVVSDTFLALWNHAASVQPGKVRAYLGAVARNAARSRLRKLGDDLPLDDNVLVIDINTPEHILEQEERQRLVRQAVLSMTQPDREIFLRFYFYGQRMEQICAETGMSLSAVKSRLFRGREKLRATLMEQVQ